MLTNQYTIEIPCSLTTDEQDPQSPINALRKYNSCQRNQEIKIPITKYYEKNEYSDVQCMKKTNRIKEHSCEVTPENREMQKLFNSTQNNWQNDINQREQKANTENAKILAKCLQETSKKYKLQDEIKKFKHLIEGQTIKSQNLMKKIKRSNDQISHWQKGYFDCTKNIIDVEQSIAKIQEKIREKKLMITIDKRNFKPSSHQKNVQVKYQTVQANVRRRLKVSISQEKLNFEKKSIIDEKEVVTHQNSRKNSLSIEDNQPLFDGDFGKISQYGSDSFKKYRKVVPKALWNQKQNIPPLFQSHPRTAEKQTTKKSPIKNDIKQSYGYSYREKGFTTQNKYSNRYIANKKINNEEKKTQLCNNLSNNKNKGGQKNHKKIFPQKINVKVNIEGSARDRKMVG